MKIGKDYPEWIELRKWMDKFEEAFDDIVPLRQIPNSVSNEELISAIQKCLGTNKNLLPDIFGYRTNTENPDILD